METNRLERSPNIDAAQARALASRGILTLLPHEIGQLAQWALFHPQPHAHFEEDWPSAAAVIVKNPAGHGYLFSMCGRVFGDAPGLLECETLEDAQHHFAVAETCVAAAQMLRRLFEGEIPRETL